MGILDATNRTPVVERPRQKPPLANARRRTPAGEHHRVIRIPAGEHQQANTWANALRRTSPGEPSQANNPRRTPPFFGRQPPGKAKIRKRTPPQANAPQANKPGRTPHGERPETIKANQTNKARRRGPSRRTPVGELNRTKEGNAPGEYHQARRTYSGEQGEQTLRRRTYPGGTFPSEHPGPPPWRKS